MPDHSVNITQLISYPIKSCAGIQHQKVSINALGLEFDRQWMVIDADGRFISQRKYPKMALIQPAIHGDRLHLQAPGMADISCAIKPSADTCEATVWKDTLTVDKTDTDINQWLSSYLDSSVQLVRYGTQSQRQVDLQPTQTAQPVAFADAFPLLVTHQASLEQLNTQLSQAVGMERFRPNVVVSSDQPAWQELQWQQLGSDEVIIEVAKPCVRCVMTGVDQSQGEQTGSEVLKTLKQKFPYQNQAVFGINGIAQTIHNKTVTLAVGQKLTVQ